VAAGAILALFVGGCSSNHTGHGTAAVGVAGSPASASPSPSTRAPALAAVLKTTPANGAQAVNPTSPITVTVANGTLTAVKLTNDEGKVVQGTLSADKRSWKAGEVLGYSKPYTLTASGVSGDRKTVTTTSKFRTLTPGNMTMPYIDTAAGYAISPGGTYGVGQAIRVAFDEPIANKAAAEKALKVTTNPPQQGAWNWFDDQNVHWRPKNYFLAHTKVTVSANLYGVEVGPGLYGQADASVSFKIGDAQISKVNDADKVINVYSNGKLVKQMPTSMGKGGYVSGTQGQSISLWTNSGPHIVIGKEHDFKMNSNSYGLSSRSPEGYADIFIKWGVKVSVDGEYVHWAPWSVWAQGHQDTSHGCLNISPENSEWFYNFSQPGDIVDVEGTPQKLQIWNPGDWLVPWATWVRGSAVH
jgi:lipoprotein-anchoring transpeptidase ErfK/SrfK